MRSFAATDVGRKRKVNQDYVFRSEKPVGQLPNLFIVADGMGGHKAGDYASSFTTKAVVSEIEHSEYEGPIRIIRRAIEEANTQLIEEAMRSADRSGMGTTIVVATIIDDYLYVANVGDSRLYLVNDRITQITRDHSLVEEMVLAGKIDREEARVHPDKNIITRAIGAVSSIKVDVFDLSLQDGDKILMCTDGLSNMVADKDIRDIVDQGKDVEQITADLIQTANENGGRDNIGVVVVDPFAEK
ncbi:MAG: Stp1/IreP family PP2C-type Ser/Thr phosphatase [Lachnospiraceae bacterium]|nr:Stp1/IreP family PP2C-type Ser/Thr phosphatase [Lachnospiraceae bacterium]